MAKKQGIRFDRNQLDFLKDAKGKLAKASAATVATVGKFALSSIMKNVTVRAYSPSELSSKNHPYARRHGSIQTSGLGSRPPYAVGTKSGKFAKSIKGQTTNQYEYAITYVQNESTQRIVSGTKVMLPRNPIVLTVQDRKFKTALQKAMTDTFKKKVRNA